MEIAGAEYDKIRRALATIIATIKVNVARASNEGGTALSKRKTRNPKIA